MKRIMMMLLLLALTFSTVLGCATKGKDADLKPGPEGELGPQGEGGWENPNM
jgi:hypothetical protein